MTRQKNQPEKTLEQAEFAKQLSKIDETGSLWSEIKAVAKTAWDNPGGALHEVTAQTPTMAAVMAPMAAGAAIGMVLGGPIGSVLGGFAGRWFGNVAIETGAIAQENAAKGTYDRQEAFQGGIVKGSVINAIDSVTMGVTGWLMSAPARAASKAATNVLVKNGVDIADDVAVKAFLKANQGVAKEIDDVVGQAISQANKGLKPVGRGAASFAGESVSEGAGEFAGSALAPGTEASVRESVLEGMMSVPTSVADIAVSKVAGEALAMKDNIIDRSKNQTLDKAKQANAALAGQAIPDTPVDPKTRAMELFAAWKQGASETDVEDVLRESPEIQTHFNSLIDLERSEVAAESQEETGGTSDTTQQARQASEGLLSEVPGGTPDYAITKEGMAESQGLLSQNIDTFRRTRSREASVEALEKRQDAIGSEPTSYAMRQFQSALEGKPDESEIPLPADMPSFQRRLEPVEDKTKFRPFAGLDEKIKKSRTFDSAKTDTIQGRMVDDGIEVAGDTGIRTSADIDQEKFNKGMTTGFGMQDLPAEEISRMKPVFENAVEDTPAETEQPAKVLTPGARVSWTDKKGNKLSGELLRERNKSGDLWQIRKDDGKTTFANVKDLRVESVVKDSLTTEDVQPDQVTDAGKMVDAGTAKNTSKNIATIMRHPDGDGYAVKVGKGYVNGGEGVAGGGFIGKFATIEDARAKGIKHLRQDKWSIQVDPDIENNQPVQANEMVEAGIKEDQSIKPDDLMGAIGRNPDGKRIYVDERGARSYQEESGLRVGHPVRLIPTRSGVMPQAHNPKELYKQGATDYLTTEEIAAFDKEKAKPEPKTETNGQPEKSRVSKFFTDAFRSGKSFPTISHARKTLAEETGVTVKPGDQAAKMVDEAIEVAGGNAAKAIVESGRKHSKPASAVFDRLVELQSRMPNLSVRTSTSVRDQAYSTPLPLAFVASELAGITPSKTVYEPSAGNGALLIGASPDKITANELNPDRHQTLIDMGITNALNSDGTQATAKEKVDVVIGNPPFGTVKDDAGVSKTWKINDQYSTTQIDHAMVFKALESMKDDGRAVFIVGSINKLAKTPEARKRAYRTKDKVSFYKTLFDNYNVVDHFTVSGDLYTQQGAGWPVDFIVIEGKGKSNIPLPGAVPPNYLKTLEELKGKLDGQTKRRPDSLDNAGGKPGSMAVSGMGSKGIGNADQKVSQRTDDGSGSRPDRPVRESGRGGKVSPAETGGRKLDNELDTVNQDGGVGSSEYRDERKVLGADELDGPGRKPADGTPDKNRSGSRRDSKPDDTGGLDGQSDNAVTDEFSPENLLAEWDKQTETITAAEKAKEAKQHFSNAVDKFKQINRLLGERGSFSTEKIDENVYKEIKTLLQEALSEIIEAGKSAKDFVKLAIENLSPKAKPYFERFVKTDMVVDKKPEPVKSEVPVKKPAPKKEKASSGQVAYESYSKAGAIGTLTPINMAEAVKKSMDTLTQKHGPVDQFVADKLGYSIDEVTGKNGEYGYFSAEQIDAIALAINNIDNGAGFIIGDQTGVGKGRVVAAMIRFAIKEGLTPIFVTEKPNLYTDMYRDLSDIGMSDISDKILITNGNTKISLTEDGDKSIRTKSNHNDLLKEITNNGHLPSQYEVIFTTYDQNNKPGSAQRNFLEAMAKGKGMLIMDEAHKAGGTPDAKETNEKYPRSIWFRRLIESAHSTFYSSATYAKRPDVMDLYSKTDMRLAVDDIKDLGEAIGKGGVPLQQATAAMLVEAGQYLRRERSFDGVEYGTKEVSVNLEKAAQMSTALSEIKEFSDTFIDTVVSEIGDTQAGAGIGVGAGTAAGEAKISSTGFSSVMHNIISQMLLALKVEAAANEAIRVFKEGKKPVITLSNTMGSFIEEYAEENQLNPGDGIGLKFNDLLFNYLEKTRHYTEKQPWSKGPGEKKYISDAELGPEGVQAFKRVKDAIYALDLDGVPVSPVDYMMTKLRAAGISVDEITGRHHTIEYRPDGTQRYRRRGAKDLSTAAKTKTIFNFNTDKTNAMILNQSGATGLSLHAMPKFEGHDPAPRVMIIAQAEANIDTHMQMLGRVHRAGQVKPPSYIQLMGNIPSEKRPAAVLAGKMASLNANTTAAKDSEVTAKNVVDFINKYGNKVVAGLMADFPEMHHALGDPLKSSDTTESGFEEDGAARKVTGRIPLLRTIKEQEDLYAMIEEGYIDLIDQLDATGENDLEAKTFETDAKTLRSAVVFDGKGTSPFTGKAIAEEVDMKKLGKSYSSEEVANLLKENILNLDPKEAKKTDKDLNEISAMGASRHFENQSSVMDAFKEYKREVLDDIEKEERKRATEARLDAVEDDWSRIYDQVAPGSVFEMPIGDTYYETVVLSVEQKGSPNNPLALGTWKVTVAVPDSTRRLTVPFSFINKLESFSNVGRVNKNILSRFDRASQTARETRTIMTGNLLAAFARYPRGRIINFTDDQGRVKQGILMPADFDLNKESKERTVTINSVDDVLTVLQNQIFIKAKRGDLGITPKAGAYSISVPASKAKGGNYFLNDGLVKAIGKDFVKSGNRMLVTFDAGRIRKVVGHLMNNMDELFVSVVDHEKIRQLLGVKTVGFAKDVTGNGPVKNSADRYYEMIAGEGPVLVSDAIPVTIEGYEAFDFFAHKSKGRWKISEKSTGLMISAKDTMVDVRADASEKIKRYSPDKFKELLDSRPKIQTPDGVQFSTDTDNAPGQGVTLKDIQKRFKGQDVFLSPDGSISIRLKNGKGIIVRRVTFEREMVNLAIESGRMSEGGVILGTAEKNVMSLNKDFADNFTRDHELWHILDNMGMINRDDKAVLMGQYLKERRSGTINFKHNNDRSETLANIFAHVLKQREQHRGTKIGAIIQKVLDFIDGLLHIGRQSVRKLAREVESGKVFERDAGQQISRDGNGAAFSVAPATESKAFKDWFGESVVTVDGKPGSEPLRVYHGTRADFSKFDKDFWGSNLSAEAQDGFFFTTDPEEASGYVGGSAPGGRVVPVYLSLKNPTILTYEQHGIDNIIDSDEALAKLLKKSHSAISKIKRVDGLILKNIGGGTESLYVAFSPTQIKSVFNRGTFDPANPDIRYQTSEDKYPTTPSINLIPADLRISRMARKDPLLGEKQVLAREEYKEAKDKEDRLTDLETCLKSLRAR